MTHPDFNARAELVRTRRSPLSQLIGLQLVRAAPSEAHTVLPYDPVFIGDGATGVLHGGLVTTLLDETCGCAVHLALNQITAIATLDLRIDYMRPAVPGVALLAHAVCYRVTRMVAFVRATAYEDSEDQPVATATATFMLGANRADLRLGEAKVTPDMLPKLEAPPSDGPFADSPYTRFLGVELREDGTTLLPKAPKLTGNPLLPALHGGAIGAFLETTAMTEVMRDKDQRRPKPVNVTINYLRSGRLEDLRGRATIVKQGRRVVAFESRAWQEREDKPIATAYGHFLLRTDPRDELGPA